MLLCPKLNTLLETHIEQSKYTDNDKKATNCQEWGNSNMTKRMTGITIT